MTRIWSPLAASILALASFALPWQIDVERTLAGHAGGMPMQHAGAMAADAPGDDAKDLPHDHGAECFWCVAMVGSVAATTMPAPIDVARPAPRAGDAVSVFVHLVTHDAVPRAPPAPTNAIA